MRLGKLLFLPRGRHAARRRDGNFPVPGGILCSVAMTISGKDREYIVVKNTFIAVKGNILIATGTIMVYTMYQ